MVPSWAASVARNLAWIVSARSRAKTLTRASRSSGTSPSFEEQMGWSGAGAGPFGRDQRLGYGLCKSLRLDSVLRRRGSASGYRAPRRGFTLPRLRSTGHGVAAAAACADAAAGVEQPAMAQRAGGCDPVVGLLHLRGRLAIRFDSQGGPFLGGGAGVAWPAGAQSESFVFAVHPHDGDDISGGVHGVALLHSTIPGNPIVRRGDWRLD